MEHEQRELPAARERVPFTQPLFWIVGAYATIFFLFFIYPIFLNPEREMLFPQYVSIITPIADDFHYLMEFCTTWLIRNESPYDGIRFYHPPLTLVIFSPLIFLKFSQAFFIMTVLTYLGFLGSSLMFPTLMDRTRRLTPLTMLLFAAGLTSFGFQFELERGQFYSFTLFLCYLSIYLFHYHPRWRWLAYLLFSISIQIKFFPAIFIFLFIHDWRDWRANLRRFAGLGLINFALLFVLGPQVFLQFVEVVLHQSREPYVWTANHSITSFVTLMAGQGTWLRNNLWAGQIPFMTIYLVCLGWSLVTAYRRCQVNPNPNILLICVLGGLIIPAVSHDYSLPVLAGPVALFLASAMEIKAHSWRKWLALFLTTLAAASYFSTLFSDVYKTLLPDLWKDNFPALLVMAICASALNAIDQSLEFRTRGNHE